MTNKTDGILSYLKTVYYHLTNKELKTRIIATRTYPFFIINISKLMDHPDIKVSEGKMDEHLICSKCSIDMATEDGQNYDITFLPAATSYQTGKETIVTIEPVNSINFRYREKADYGKYLTDIEHIFQLIESTYYLESECTSRNIHFS